ncbi:hypothetical protein D3C87_2074760 [compost metagenome]
MSGPAKQFYTQLFLQRVNLLAERRLANAEPFRRPRDVALVSDGEKVPNMPQLHAISAVIYIRKMR